MAGKADILAGRAAVGLLLKDNGFSKGITAAGKKFQSTGKTFAVVGAAITAAGAAIVTPLLAMTKEFADTGSALNDMSARTGQSVESLSELKFAAEQSGASLDDVEQALRQMAKNNDHRSFDEVAASIAAIQDPTQRAHAALEAWGKGGTALLPMIADLAALRQEARDAGLVMSGDAAKRADALGDAFDKLRAIIESVRLVIGDALSGTVREAIGSITNLAITIGKWVSQNRELFVSALKIGVVLTGVGTALVALGGIVSASGFAVIGINAALGMMAALLSALVSPIGLVVGAVAGLATWFATSTTWGQQMVTSLAGWFGELRDIAVETFGGIADALSAGNLALAAKVAWAGIKLEFLTATQSIRQAWIEFKDLFMRTTLDIVFSAQNLWAKYASGVKGIWAGMVTESKSIGETIGHWLTRSSDPATAAEQDQAHNQALQRIKTEGAADLQRIKNEKAAELAAIQAARETAGGTQDAATNKSIADAKAALEQAKADLATLRGQSAKDRKDHELKGGPKFDPANVPTGDMIKSQVFGTFSAAAAGGGASAESPTVKELREQRGIHQMALKEATRIRRAAEKAGLMS